MNIQSQLKKMKSGKYQYIYVYFKHRGKIIRVNTGNEFVSSYMTKELMYNSKYEGSEEKNRKTKELKTKVDEYLRHKLVLMEDSNISQEECQRFIRGEKLPNYRIIPLTKEEKKEQKKKVREHLNDFLSFKKNELLEINSYKNYNTLVNTLNDYETNKKKELTFEYMNTEEFLVDFRNFLTLKRSGDEYKTEGGLSNNTIHKRFSNLKSFFNWLEKRKIFKFDKLIYDFKIKQFEKEIVVLSKEEIKTLYELDKFTKNEQKIIDVFVCNCGMGLRISDLKTLNKEDFTTDSDGDVILKKENHKTGFSSEILIQSISLKVLEKYNYELPKYSEQYFNRRLKEIFIKYDLFNEPLINKKRSNKQILDEQVLKRDLISSHTCRRTFITIGLVSGVQINVLMNSTGHKEIRTLQRYAKKMMDKESLKRMSIG